MKRLSSDAGIAIGPILFLLAILGVIATVMSASNGGSGFGAAGVADRVTAEIAGQANMIRSKINECQMQYLANSQTFATGSCGSDSYPCHTDAAGTLVADLTCPNDPLVGGAEQSLWSGPRPALLPPPSGGFAAWKYYNGGDVGGRCFWTAPTATSGSIGDGLARAAQKFTSAEVTYNSTTQKFVVFVTRPSSVASTADPCKAP